MSAIPRVETAPVGRREFFKATAVAAGLSLVGPRTSSASPDRKRALRVAHLTDVHVYPDRGAPAGMTDCLRHVQALAEKPDLILFGGDAVMDAFEQSRARTEVQWGLWKAVLKAENALPYRACIGNHDIWGWRKSKSGATGQEPDFGKKWAVDALGIPGRYYSFDQAGWHFIVLDSIQPGPDEKSYAAFLDDEQLQWLKDDLARVPATTPILIWSHVPIASALPVLGKRKEPHGDLNIYPGGVHNDARALVDLLATHPNVKACLSGHLHQVDHVQIKGVNYHCNGAVSGNWWKGKLEGIPEGYAVLDLFDDGSYTCRYVPYGWTARPALLGLE